MKDMMKEGIHWNRIKVPGLNDQKFLSISLIFFLYSSSFYLYEFIGLVGRVVAKWSEWPGFNPRSRHTTDFNNGTWYLLT